MVNIRPFYHDEDQEDPQVYNAAMILYSLRMNRHDELLNLAGRFVEVELLNHNELPPPDDDDPPAEEEGDHGAREGVPAIANMIGACSPPFDKTLTKSDVSHGLGRLALFKEFVNLHFAPMFNADEDLVAGIGVTVFDAQGRQYNMTFKLWTSKLYVLTSGWTVFYQANNLTQPGLNITLWMFRHVVTHRLCFAIIQRMDDEP